jgi:hypothetical protein
MKERPEPNRRKNIRDYFKRSTVNVEIFTFLLSGNFPPRAGFIHRGAGNVVETLERFAARIAGFDFVPPFDLVAFADLPTQKYDTIVTHGWEIDETE